MIGAEGRHHQAAAVGGEAAAAHRAAALAITRARDADGRRSRLGAAGGRLVAEGQRPDATALSANVPPSLAARLGIVVAGDPDPVAAALQGPQASRGRAAASRAGAAAVVEAVAERDDGARRIVGRSGVASRASVAAVS